MVLEGGPPCRRTPKTDRWSAPKSAMSTYWAAAGLATLVHQRDLFPESMPAALDIPVIRVILKVT
jgi:hypothetical protein